MRIVLRSADFQQREISQRVIENTLGVTDPEPEDVHVRMLARKRARQQSVMSDERWSAGVFDDHNRLVYATDGPGERARESESEAGPGTGQCEER